MTGSASDNDCDYPLTIVEGEAAPALQAIREQPGPLANSVESALERIRNLAFPPSFFFRAVTWGEAGHSGYISRANEGRSDETVIIWEFVGANCTIVLHYVGPAYP
ncbi:hypothetical protein [Actinoplanes couchii]|uniref:Uncharacterized protein n=1 Tax=Actinoplanes couchii TaxID=403638 RepID=A0ABQ3XJD7_9ACTN|nr:hypothetical protein [Actinoplanes couchii]MDR6324391.1 hypothetical protein [Actinoplanes couchii]GID58608.1 hypothetical protein Aco03nite_070120 [Actinoplanes couchii]